MEKKLLLIDGNSILNRAFYGIRPLTTSKGLYTQAVYGMVNILLKHLDAEKPDYCACAFDLKAPTFRHLKYDGYKATRHGMPEELAMQLPYAKRAVSGLGIRIVEKEGYEADDVLGTLAQFSATEPSLETRILTGDRDSLQLIRDNVHVLLVSTGETTETDRQRFAETHLGTTPEQFVDVKALMGDSSDNIPGVPGIGEKTALKFIAQYGSLDGLYQALETDPFTPSVLKKLREGKESAYLSQFLARIMVTAPVEVTLSDLAYTGFAKKELRAVLAETELFSLIKRLGLGSEETVSPQDTGKLSTTSTELSTSTEEMSVENVENSVETAPQSLQTAEMAALSTEILWGFSPAPVEKAVTIGAADGTSYVVRYENPTELSTWLCDQNRKLCVADSKALFRFAGENGISVTAAVSDAGLAAYVLRPTDKSYEPERLAEIYLGESGKNPAVTLARLMPVLLAKLEETEQKKLYETIELPLSRVLAGMERTGFMIDRGEITRFGEGLDARMAAYQKEIFSCAGGEFNINSTKQLGEVLYTRLGLPALRKTHTGLSTDAETLEKLRPYHPIIGNILDYRQAAKLKSTYVDGLLREADENGRVHTVFNQTVTATGRLSSSEPNLQNIPVRSELGREMRRFFIPSEKDMVLVDADYSQIELRLLAAISGDENMIEAFRSGTDIHTVTASQVFHVPLDEVTPDLRKRAKAVNFGIVYGIGDYSLSQDIGVSRYEAGEYIRRYFARYPGVKAFLDGAVRTARETGWSQTLFGRRRQIPELSSAKKTMQAFGERVAMNSPIQGAAADIIKIAMIRTQDALEESGIRARLILQVHDELILEAGGECADEAAKLLVRAMENAVSLPVTLTAEVTIGHNWMDCK